MEYIQCTHCHKKYRVNEQVRAAAGRMVKCKDCGEPIEIIILQASNDVSPDLNQQQEKEDEKNTEERQVEPPVAPKEQYIEPEPEPKPKASKQETTSPEPNKTQKTSKITLSAVLGVLIVAASLYGFFQGRNQQADDLHQTANTHNAEQAIQKNNEILPENQLLQSNTTVSKEQNTERYSDACKEAAAQQWLTDFKVTHGQQTGRDYMSLLDQGIQTSALIRKECAGSHVVAEVLQSAQKGLPPEWLVKTINELTGHNLSNEPSF